MANDTENSDQQAQAEEQDKAEGVEQSRGAADESNEEAGDSAPGQTTAEADGNWQR